MLGAISKFFIGGAVEGAVGAAQGVANVIDQFVETDDEKRAAETLKLKMLQAPQKAQAEINKIEAGHRTLFVAGWRPFIGWVCGASLSLYFIPQFAMAAYIWFKACMHVLETVTITSGNIMMVLPAYPINSDDILELVIAMLGMGGLRTLEKHLGKSK